MRCDYCEDPDAEETADPYQVEMGADFEDPEIQGWWCADCYSARKDEI